MDFCNCCGNDPKAESLDYLYKRSDCALCGKEKRSKAIKTTGMAKAVLAVEARRKLKMTSKQSDSGPKCNVGHASRVPVNKVKAQMRPVKKCKRCGMQEKQCPGDEMKLAQIMVGHFGKEIINSGDTAVKPGKKPQKDCALDIDKNKSSKKIPTDHQLITVKIPLLEPKLSETTLVCNGLNTEELEPRQPYVLHPSTGAINKRHNFKFCVHKSKAVPPLNKILSDLTLRHSASGEERKPPPEEEPINRGDIFFDTEHDPYDNDSMLVFPLKFEDNEYKYQYIDDFSGYYSPDTETSPTIETTCYSSSKLSKSSSSCPCLDQSKKLNEKYHSAKVTQPSYLHNLKLFNNQYDAVKYVHVVNDPKDEGAKVITLSKSNEVNKASKIMSILGGMKPKTTNKKLTQRAEAHISQPIRKLPVAMTHHDQKNKTHDEKLGKSTCQTNGKKIPPKIEDPKKKCILGKLGGMETEKTSLKTTQTRHFYSSLNMRKPCVAKTGHVQNVLEKGRQVIKNTKTQDTQIVNITFQSNDKKTPPSKIEDSKKKRIHGTLEGMGNKRTGLKTTQTKNAYGSLKVHEPCITRTCCNRHNQNVLKKDGQVVKDQIQDKNIVNITFPSNVKKMPQPKVEAPKKKCNNGILENMKTEKTSVKNTQNSVLHGSSKMHKPCMARTYDLSQKGNDILRKQALSLRSKHTGFIVNNKNRSLKYFVSPKAGKRQETQPQNKQLNKPAKENEVVNEALGYLRLHQATSGNNSVVSTECPKCEPPRRVLAKSVTPRTGNINTIYIKKRGKLDLPVYEPRTNFNKSITYSYKSPENETNESLKVPDKQVNLKNSITQISLIKRKEFQALKAQQALDLLETKITSSIKTQNNKILTQNKDDCELKTNINTNTNNLTTIKSKQASENILRKSLWTKFAPTASREKFVEKLNSKIQMPHIRQSMPNSKIQTSTTKHSCSVNLKELSPRMRLLLGIHPHKVATTNDQKNMQQNASHPTGIVIEKKQSKISEPKVENLQDQRRTAGNTLSHITNELHNQKEQFSAALELNSKRLDNHLCGDQLELDKTSTVIEDQVSIQNPDDFNKTSIEKTLKPIILKIKTNKDNVKFNSKKSEKIITAERAIPEKHISKLASNNRKKGTLSIEKNKLEKKDPKINCLNLKCRKQIKTVKLRVSTLKIFHNHTPRIYPDTMKKLIKNQRSNHMSPVAKTSINRLSKTTQLSTTSVQKLERSKAKSIAGKQMGQSKIPSYSNKNQINLTYTTPTSSLETSKVHIQNWSDDPVANKINPSNSMDPLLANLQQFFIEISKDEVEDLELRPKQCTVLMEAIEIGFKRTGHLVQVTPSQQQLAKMEMLLLTENRNVKEDERKVLDDILLDDLYIKRRGMIWADPVKEAQPVGRKMTKDILEIDPEKVSKHMNELEGTSKEIENQVKIDKMPPKVTHKNLKETYADQTSIAKDNMSKIPERLIPKVVKHTDPAKVEQPLEGPGNKIEINHKKDSKNKTELAKDTKEEEIQVKVYKIPTKSKNLKKLSFEDQTSIDKDNMSKIPGSKPKVIRNSEKFEHKKNLDRDFQANKPSEPQIESVGKLKSLPNQTFKERQTIHLKSLPKQYSARKNSKCESNTSSDTFYTCRQGYLPSPRHCDFPKYPKINKQNKSSTKKSARLIISQKPDFPKHSENNKIKNSSTKHSIGFNVSKKPTKQSILAGKWKSGVRGAKKFNHKPIQMFNLNLSIEKRDKLKLRGTRLLKAPKNPKIKGNIQKPKLKPNQNSSLQCNSSQESNEMALVKYQRDHDQLSTTSLTDSVGEEKKHCHFDFRNPRFVPFDLKLFRDVCPMIQSDLTNSNVIIIVKSFIAENWTSLKNKLGDGAEQTTSENREKQLQVKYLQESDLTTFMVPYIHVNCCIHNCRYLVNGSNILGHMAQCHIDWFGVKDSAKQWQKIFNDSEVMFSINPNNYVLGEICFLGLLAYGGDRNKDPPVNLEQCPKNTLLPASMHEIVQYCPIVLYACKLPVVIEKAKRKSSSKRNQCANNERLIIWASSFALPFKIEFKISVQSKDFSNLRSQTMHVRYFHKTTQNPSEFGRYDNDFLALYYGELKNLTNSFKNEFDLVISILELKYPIQQSINQ